MNTAERIRKAREFASNTWGPLLDFIFLNRDLLQVPELSSQVKSHYTWSEQKAMDDISRAIKGEEDCLLRINHRDERVVALVTNSLRRIRNGFIRSHIQSQGWLDAVSIITAKQLEFAKEDIPYNLAFFLADRKASYEKRIESSKKDTQKYEEVTSARDGFIAQ